MSSGMVDYVRNDGHSCVWFHVHDAGEKVKSKDELIRRTFTSYFLLLLSPAYAIRDKMYRKLWQKFCCCFLRLLHFRDPRLDGKFSMEKDTFPS
jgi:hypothetical protein